MPTATDHNQSSLSIIPNATLPSFMQLSYSTAKLKLPAAPNQWRPTSRITVTQFRIPLLENIYLAPPNRVISRIAVSSKTMYQSTGENFFFISCIYHRLFHSEAPHSSSPASLFTCARAPRETCPSRPCSRRYPSPSSTNASTLTTSMSTSLTKLLVISIHPDTSPAFRGPPTAALRLVKILAAQLDFLVRRHLVVPPLRLRPVPSVPSSSSSWRGLGTLRLRRVWLD